ncbi:MAG: hypothetical protein IPP96_13450 [Chitinophagaceae bacterium]|nr:hypothetical protein [Chitinophagaceae bacterium]
MVPVNSIIPLTDNSINAISIQWLYDGAFTGITSPVWNYTVTAGIHTISLVAFNGGCSDTITVVYFSAGTAHNLDSLFMAQYGTYMFNEEGTCIDKTPDSGFIAGGVQYPWNTCGQFGVLVKTRIKGCIDWSKNCVSI